MKHAKNNRKNPAIIDGDMTMGHSFTDCVVCVLFRSFSCLCFFSVTMSYRIISSLFTCCFDPFLVCVLFGSSRYHIVPDYFLSLYVLFRSFSCSCTSRFHCIFRSVSLCVVPDYFLHFYMLFQSVSCYSSCYSLFGSWNSYSMDSNAPLSQADLFTIVSVTFSSTDPASNDLCIRMELGSEIATLPVLLNQIIPSKDNELRLNKAARSPQHRNKEMSTNNRCEMYCTRQQVSLSTVVRF